MFSIAKTFSKLEDLLIPNGTNVSNNIRIEDAEALLVIADSVTDGVLTYTFEVTTDISSLGAPAAGAVFATLQNATPADVVPPLAGKARSLIDEIKGCIYIRIKSSANVTANRNWRVGKTTYSG